MKTSMVIESVSSILTDCQEINPSVAALDFERLKWKLSYSSEATMSPEMCNLAEREYRRFLTLKIESPNAILVPTKLVDKFWHAHILDTAAYAHDCDALFGQFMHHFPYFGIYGDDDKQNLENAFTQTRKLYKSRFGEDLPLYEVSNCEDDHKTLSTAARCNGHSCHVPSACACRVSGACK